MAIQKLYKSRLKSVQYFFKNGLMAMFINGRYSTDDDTQIAELDAEIKARHPHIYVDANEKEVDSERLDPLEHIKKKAIEEYLAEQAKKVGTNFGKTDESAGDGAGMLTSAKVAEAAAESTGAPVGNKLNISIGPKVGK